MGEKRKYPRYIEWFSPAEMHDHSRTWLSHLDFMQHEQEFLNGLITFYMGQLADSRLYNRSKKIINGLLDLEKKITALHDVVVKHEAQLEIMIDKIDQPKMESAYRDEHHDLLKRMQDYESEYKKVKKSLFTLISEIIRKEKQQHLLN